MNTADIEWVRLAAGYGILVVPLSILISYRTKLVIPVIVAAFRMTVQLLLVGIYLKYLFLWNNAFLNFAWATVMVMIAAPTVVHRADLSGLRYVIPVFGAIFLSVFVTTGFLLMGILNLSSPFDARYMIPIMGMIIGNSMNSSIIGVRSFHSILNRQLSSYRYRLACGATPREASDIFIRESLINAYSPSIATMANVGLISLPGMMTGQILGGSNPVLSIKYQILIMLGIHTGSISTVFLSLRFSRRWLLRE